MGAAPRLMEGYRAGSLWVDVYDTLMDDLIAGSSADGDIGFYLDHAAETDGPVLDLGCGTGRVTFPLAAAGHVVTGLDLSPAMLEIAAARMATLPESARERVHFVEGDMTDFDLGNHFSLVLIPLRSFHALGSVEAQRRALRAAHRHLRPGGRLVVDLLDPRPEHFAPDGPGLVFRSRVLAHPTRSTHVHVTVRSRTIDPVAQVLTETWQLSEVGPAGVVARDEETLVFRWCRREEMREMLDEAGFEVEAEFSDFRRSPPGLRGEQVWVAGRA